MVMLNEGLLNRVPCVLECQRGRRAKVLAFLRGLRVNIPARERAKTCQLFIFTSQGVNKRVNVSNGEPIFSKCFNWAGQCAKRRANFSIWSVNMP